jgi:hypothetical protein
MICYLSLPLKQGGSIHWYWSRQLILLMSMRLWVWMTTAAETNPYPEQCCAASLGSKQHAVA